MSAFQLGDHTFLEPGGPPAPIDRIFRQPRHPIRGAGPPSFLAQFAIASSGQGPASALWNGDFCGHREPTFTVFDLAVGGHREIELAVPFQPSDEPSVLIRRAGARDAWQRLCALHELFPDYCSYDFKGQAPQPVVDKRGQPLQVRAAIGCEYPCEATNIDDISWLAIVIEYGRNRELGEVFSRETA